MRVLDIGARDGFFSFECERRAAAEVVAIDYLTPEETGFPIARELVGSQVELRQVNVYDLSPEEFGSFDLVLFLGVLYRLRDPMLALDRIAESIPIMQFYPGGSLNNDPSNTWAPNQACLRAMLEESGFAVDHGLRMGYRAIAFGHRTEDGVRDFWRRRDRAVGRKL